MKAVITSGIAAMMRSPGPGPAVDEVLCGMEADLLDYRPGWYKIRTLYRYEGWINGAQLCPDEAVAAEWASRPKRIVLQPWADILSSPTVQSAPVESVPRGALVSPLDPPADGWQHVLLSGLRQGYLPAQFLGEHITSWKAEDEDHLRRALVKTALAYLGTQYRWGGKTPLGIDCSGLCSMAYLINGVIIYRDAEIVPGFPLHEIPFESRAPGDLLFFPGHVAMYIGDNRYVHSTGKAGSNGVVINSLDPAAPDYRGDLPVLLRATGSIF